jgi:hypothetical protein
MFIAEVALDKIDGLKVGLHMVIPQGIPIGALPG